MLRKSYCLRKFGWKILEGNIFSIEIARIAQKLCTFLLHSGGIGRHSDVQVGKLAKHFTIVRIQSFRKGRIVQFGLTFGFGHVAQRMQSLQKRLAACGRHLLPARKQGLAHISLLLGSHLFPDALAVAQRLLLLGRQAVPGFEALANLRLLLRRQILKTLIVAEKLFLPLRRHVLKALDGFRRQFIGIGRGGNCVGQPGAHSRARRQRPCRLAFLLRGRVRSLRVGGAAQEPSREPRGQNQAELESSLHFLSL